MKSKIDITSSVSLDEIREQLLSNLSTHQLVEFALQLGDDMSDSEDYYHLLGKKLNKINKLNET